jgi:hypothetical protein
MFKTSHTVKRQARRCCLLISFVFLLAGTVHAQTPDPPHPQHTDPFWQVAYWNNMALSGDPVVQGSDQHLAWDWGGGSPRNGVNADHFSARWTRYVDVTEPGTYRFVAISDDGIRVYVDGDAVIDEWHDHAASRFVGDVNLTVGHHLVVVEYYENMGAAVAKLTWWGPVPVMPHSWRGEYFANHRLTGEPVLVRDDPVDGASGGLSFNWGTGSPAAHIPSDGFSIRWIRTVPLNPGAYRFTATSDDGIRVWADDHLVIDQWYDHPAQTFTGDVNLTGANHTIVVEYYENRGVAVAKVSWEPVPTPSQGWRGEYFANRWLSDPPVLVRDDLNLGFNWSYGSPAKGIPSDNFSVRWTRTFHFEPESYRFTTTTDDGVRLWVNGHLLIDQWQDQALSPHSGTIYLSGDVPIKMEYYEHGGLASAWLTWDRDGGPPPPPPPPSGAIVVDDADRGFVTGGSTTGWRTVPEGYGGRLTWTRNNDRSRYNYNWARWYPDLSPGRYEVFVFIPERYTTTSRARYWVSHRDSYTLCLVDQSVNGDRWVSLGTYWFRGSRDDYVSLADVTYEPYRSRLIGFDAVKWELR